HWLELAASDNSAAVNKQDSEKAKLALGLLYLTSNASVTDINKAVAWLTEAGNAGDAEAQYHLGRLYEGTLGVRADLAAARNWYTKSADQNYVKAQHALAEMYLKESDAEDSYKQAIYWLKKAADNGDLLSKEQLKSLASDQQKTYHDVSDTEMITPKLVTVSKSDIFNTVYTLENPKSQSLKQLLSWADANVQIQRKPNIYAYHLPAEERDQSKLQTNFNAILKEAVHGSAKAQFKVAQMYEQGYGVTQDKKIAAEWYLSAAKQDFAKAKYNLALMYLRGQGIKQNTKEALYWVNSAATSHDGYAQYLLGTFYEYGLETVSKDRSKAEQFYAMAADQDIADAQFNLAQLYAEDAAALTDATARSELNSKIIQLYQKAVLQGHLNAQELLATYYLQNTQNHEVLARAYRIANEAATRGSVQGSLLVAIMLDRGIGVKANQNEAMAWYEKATEGKSAIAEYILGTYLYQGTGIAQDTKGGLRLLEAAAQQGYPFAQYNYAVLLQNSNTKDSNASAIALIEKSAIQANEKAKLFLADYYISHNKSSDKITEAAKLYEKAAENGDASAQLKIGYMYAQGIGV
ncbi:MAG TPA: tetratricopeptide repeat protein, partial [Legionellaceae bacterium]|nr:tetratricopeptide repeat protein [Legionellaceae bacterium]